MYAATLFFGIMNYCGINIAGVIQIILAFALSGGVLVLFGGVLSTESTHLSNLAPLFAEHRPPLLSILSILAIAPFLFVGFDTVPQTAEEFSFPHSKSRNIMLAAILWGAVLYSLVTLSVALLVPYPEMLARMDVLRAQGQTAWATGEVCNIVFGRLGSVVLAVSVLGAVCTGINGFYVATTRLLLSMARGSILPKWFAEIHPRFQSPHKAIVFTIDITQRQFRAAALPCAPAWCFFCRRIRHSWQTGNCSSCRIRPGRSWPIWVCPSVGTACRTAASSTPARPMA